MYNINEIKKLIIFNAITILDKFKKKTYISYTVE